MDNQNNAKLALESALKRAKTAVDELQMKCDKHQAEHDTLKQQMELLNKQKTSLEGTIF